MSGNDIRFSVRTPEGFRSATWKCFSLKGKDDFYLVCRELKGATKVSFHESGKWHIGFTKAFLEKEVSKDSPLSIDRYTSKWTEPNELSPGVTPVIRIIIPEFAIDVPIREEHKGLFWVPSPPKGMAIEILIFMTNSEARVMSLPDALAKMTSMIGKIDLASGKKVWVVYRVRDFPQFKLPTKTQATFFKSSPKENVVTGPGLRAIITMVNKDGSRFLVEMPIKKMEITNPQAGQH